MSDTSSTVVKKTSSSSTSSTSSSVVKTSSSSVSYKSSSQKVVTSSGLPGSGLDIDAEVERMKLKLDSQMGLMKLEALKLLPAVPSGAGPMTDLIKLDHQSIQQYIDDAHKDKVRFNFDVTEFQKESVVVTSDGNKIVVHAKKAVKKADGEEATEEYSRVYELPTGVDAKSVTSSLNKDAKTFTVELPVINLEIK